MTRRRSIVAFATVLLIATAFVRAQEGGLKLAEVSPGELHFALMPNGTYQANVVGDITKPGPYAVRTKLPAGLRLPPHFHPEPRIVLIVSGTLYVGYGDRFDETKMVALPAGSVFTEPSKQSHFTWAKDGEVVLHVTGQGPSATTWLDQK
ncbi:MAG: cupin domain-containing protein [Acidobacteria bacterium]|nr:cupin domain-containing protein [Acidobacteriota bacterium]